MKPNNSQMADEGNAMRSDIASLASPTFPFIFNASHEANVYYNVTDAIVSVLNATEFVDMEDYADVHTTPSAADAANACYRVVVDCSNHENDYSNADYDADEDMTQRFKRRTGGPQNEVS